MTAIKEILVINHSHTDVGYTHPQPVFWELSRRFIDEAIDLCDQTADWPVDSQLKWTCEVTCAVMDWLRHANDRQIERFVGAAKRGQIAVGAMFCNMTPLYNLEQFAQSLLPVRTLREDFGVEISVAINHDVNGLPWSFIPVLLDADLTGLLMGINIHFGGFPLHRPMGFRWQGPDRRTIPAFNGEHYQRFDAYLNLSDPEPTTARMAEGLDTYLARLRENNYPYDFAYLTSTHPFFCDNNPPSPNFARMVRQWNEHGREPVIRIVTPDQVIKRLREQRDDDVPVHRGDWTDYWNFGSGSAALEGSVNRAARRRLHAAQMLSTVTPMSDRSRSHMNEAREHLNLYDEHTWGSFCGILSKLPTLYHDAWTFKAAYAFGAASYSAMLMRDLLDQQAGNPTQGDGVDSYLLYNPAPKARKVCFTVDKNFAGGKYHHLCSTLHRLDTEFRLRSEECEVYGIDAVTVGPIEVPPMSVQVVSPEEFTPAPAADGISIDGEVIESPYHRVSFDSRTGRITELVDKSLDRDVIDHESEWSFFECVRETVAEYPERAAQLKDDREAFFKSDWGAIHSDQSGWMTDWKANRDGPQRLISIDVEHLPDGARLRRRYEMDGCDDFTQTITLCAFEPTVKLEAFFKKEDVREPEGMYFTLPFAIPNWRAHYDTAGTATEFDAEQLPGSCRDWITADSYVAMHNDECCVTVACPDAPLFQLGGFNFARHRPACPNRDRAWIIAWPMNNYWHTNFRPSQPGYVRLRYELRADTTFDPWESACFARTAATPVELHPIVTGARATAVQLISIDGDGVVLEHIKSTEDGQGTLVRLINHRDHDVETSLRLPNRQIAKAFRCNVLEQVQEGLTTTKDSLVLNMPARAVQTILIVA